MTLPKKRRRNIVVDGTLFHWTDNFETHRQSSAAIQRADDQGPLIKAYVRGDLLPAIIEHAIRFVLDFEDVAKLKQVDIGIDASKTPPEFTRVEKNDPRFLRKKWALVTADLRKTQKLIAKIHPDLDFNEFESYLDHNELELAMESLAAIVPDKCSDGEVWRMFASAAEGMNLQKRAGEFRQKLLTMTSDPQE